MQRRRARRTARNSAGLHTLMLCFLRESYDAKGNTRRIEVMDTTLRDGEQAEGISMMPEEKRTIAQRLLETVKVDRIEVASARVSEGERRAVKTIIDYADSKGLDRSRRDSGVRRRQSIRRLGEVGGRARHQPADEGLAASLPRAVEEDARAAPRRHPQRRSSTA